MLKTSSVVTGILSQLVAAVVALAVAFGLSLTADQVAAIMGLTSVVGMVATFVLWARTVDRAQVVEALIGEDVIAGEANDLVMAGETVRSIPKRALTEEA